MGNEYEPKDSLTNYIQYYLHLLGNKICIIILLYCYTIKERNEC